MTPTVIYYKPPPRLVPIFWKKTVPASTPSSKLSPGQSLSRGESLVSPNSVFRFKFQSDGNLVLLRQDFPIWHANTQNQGGSLLVQQTDGNLVLYTPENVALWATMTMGHPTAFFQMQDDGNAVSYEGITPLWETRTWGGSYHDEGKSWLESIATTVGRPFAELAKGASEAWSEVTEFVGDIPIIGPALHGVFVIAGGPFSFTAAIVEGERLDKALIKDLRDKITAIREVAPYVQTVMSFIPGIGTGVAAAIGAGLALAQGRPIDEALLEGVRSGIPGGPIARAAFTVTVAAASGKNLIKAAGEAGIEALNLPPEAKKGLEKALNVAYQAAQGENIPLAVLNEARDYMPSPEAKQAFDVAVAMAQGKKLQDTLLDALQNATPAEKAIVHNVGRDLIEKTPILKEASNTAAKAGGFAGYGTREGFEYGIGLARHAGANEMVLMMARNEMDQYHRQGFDMALAAYKTAVKTHIPPSAPVQEAAAFIVTKGLAGNPNPQIKVNAVRTFLIDPNSARGTMKAIAQIEAKRMTFWQWLKGLVGLR